MQPIVVNDDVAGFYCLWVNFVSIQVVFMLSSYNENYCSTSLDHPMLQLIFARRLAQIGRKKQLREMICLLT